MDVVTVQNAKTHLSRLIARVEAGAEVVIARGKHPVARLVRIDATAPQGRLRGAAKGLYPRPPDSFFEPLADAELALWDGAGDADGDGSKAAIP